MKMVAVLLVILAAVHPLSASADADTGPFELNATGLDYVAGGMSSIVPPEGSLSQRALADVLGQYYAPLNNPSLYNNQSSSGNSENGEDSGAEDAPRTASEVLANFFGSGQTSGGAGSGPTSGGAGTSQTGDAASAPAVINVPAAQREYIRNLTGTGLSVIEPLARGGQFRDFVHHQVQNQR